MKKINLFLFFAGIICQVYSQDHNYNLPAEFKEIAVQAFQKVSPATKQWFSDMAAQHPVGASDTAWIRKKLKDKFGATGIDPEDELWIVMMDYQRMLNKENKEDTRKTGQDRQPALNAKENKLKQDNAAIDRGMKEAREKADNTMTAANSNLVMGVVAGVAGTSMLTAANNQNTNNLSATGTKINSSKLQLKNVGTNEQAQKTGRQKPGTVVSMDKKKGMQDAIRKLQNQLAELGKTIKL